MVSEYDRLKFLSAPPLNPPKELVEIMKRVSQKLHDLGAHVIILHDEYMIEAPAGKEKEAMEALNELTNWQLAQTMKGFSNLKAVPALVDPTWDDLKK